MSAGAKKSGSAERILVRELKILNKLGLHARPAALFVKAACRFVSDITVERGGNEVSGKSIMGLMTLEAGMGCVLKITVDGPDAETAMNELQKLIEDKFFEEG
jgi:phosphocarrier protein HPr